MSIRTLLWLTPGAAVLIALPQIVKSSFAVDIFIRILLFSFIGIRLEFDGRLRKNWLTRSTPRISGSAPTPRRSFR